MSRQGRITASRALDFMTNGRGKDNMFGETAKTYAKQLALARMGIETDEGLSTWQMEWGIDWEPEAIKVYEQSRGQVHRPGFIEYGEFAGCTPDASIGEDGLLEVKCPQWKNHMEYLMEGPEKRYIYQMQFQMMVTGAKWCDFMTFHPHFPDKLKAKVFRIERDEELIAQFEDRLEPFNELIESYIQKLS